MLKQNPASPHLDSIVYLLAVALPTLYHLNFLLKYTEKEIIQKHQCKCFNAYLFFLCVTNLGDYAVYLSKHKIKGY